MRWFKIKSVHSVKDLGVIVTSNLKFSQQCREPVSKQTGWWVWLREYFHSRLKMLYYFCMIVLSNLMWREVTHYPQGLPITLRARVTTGLLQFTLRDSEVTTACLTSRNYSLIGKQGCGGIRKKHPKFSTLPWDRTRALSVLRRVCYHCTKVSPSRKTLISWRVFRVEQTNYSFVTKQTLLGKAGTSYPVFSLSKKKTPLTRVIDRLLWNIFNVLVCTNVDPTKLFVMDGWMDNSTWTGNNGAKFKCRQVHSNFIKFFFTVRDWNRLPPSMVQCNSITSFKNNLDRYLLHLNVHYITFNVMVTAQQLSFRFRIDHLVLVLRPVWSGYLCKIM